MQPITKQMTTTSIVAGMARKQLAREIMPRTAWTVKRTIVRAEDLTEGIKVEAVS